MPKKKKNQSVQEETIEIDSGMSLAEKQSKLDKFCKEITEQGIAVAGRVDKSQEVRDRLTFHFIPTPVDAVNEALGGGIPVGKISIIYGPSDSGKTGLALSTIGLNMQKNPNFTALWIESEESLDIDEASKLYHIDVNRFFAIAPTRKTGAEGVASAIESAIQQVQPNVVVINSLKMLVPKSELDKPMDKVSVAEQARFNAMLMKKFVTLCAEAKTAMILIQHITTKIGGFSMYGDPTTMAGGLAIRFNSMVQLELKQLSIGDADPVTKETGMKIKARVTKNHCVIDRCPYCTAEYFIEYGKGVEVIISTLNILIEKGIVTKSGAWLYLLDDSGDKNPDWSWQGKSKFKEDMEENPNKFEKLRGLLSGSLAKQMTESEIEELKKQENKDQQMMEEVTNNCPADGEEPTA